MSELSKDGQEPTKINESTLLPISMLIAVVGFVFWLSGIYYNEIANAKAIEEVKIEQKVYNDTVISIDKRLIVIESWVRKENKYGR